MEREYRKLTEAGMGLKLALECRETDLALKWLQQRANDSGPSLVIASRAPVAQAVIEEMVRHKLIFPFHECAGDDLSGHLLTPLGDTVCRISKHMSQQVGEKTAGIFRQDWGPIPNLATEFKSHHRSPK